jgi:hypothetical protein
MTPAKRRAYLEAMGWPHSEVEALLAIPVRGAVDELQIALCESGELRRQMREVTRWFSEAKVIAVRAL